MNLFKNKAVIIVIAIFICELFLRFYQMDTKSPFGFDQVGDAWAAKSIIVDHKFPLVGAVAKTNSGIYVGPLYQYLIALVYLLFNLNPISSAVFAGLTSIFTFWIIYIFFKKLFSIEVAVIGVFLNTFIYQAINFDRVQWPVNFIPLVSLMILYLLYKILLGDIEKLPYLALLLGISFSIHFTSIFHLILIILSLPFFPRTKKTLHYILISIPIFLVFLIPNIVYVLQQKTGGGSSYIASYFHGFHIKRVIQLIGDGLIQFNPYLDSIRLTTLKFMLLPLFFITYLYKSISKQKLIFCYLISIWFIVPWFVFATYRGEISDYYFSINRYVALFIISYFFAKIWMVRNILPKLSVIVLLIYIAFINVNSYLSYKDKGLLAEYKTVSRAIRQNNRIEFQVGVPESYIYYYLMKQKGVEDVYN